MLALIAGTGGLPAALVARLDTPPLVIGLAGFTPEVPVDRMFQIEHLGTLLRDLCAQGVSEVCFAGAVRRPAVEPAQIDALTLPLVPQIMQAIGQGDDGALRIIIALFEDHGIRVRAAHEIAPDLLPDVHVPQGMTDGFHVDAQIGEACIAQMGAADVGQACVVVGGAVVAQEDIAGTDAMLATLGPEVAGGILCKAPKPNQDRRADLPVVGPETVKRAGAAGLVGIVIEAGGVMVLDMVAVTQALDKHGLWLWVRPKGAA